MSYYQQPPGTPGWPAPQPPQRRHRGLKWALISGCLAIALVFAATAYILFFSGAPPEDVVEDYVSAANSQDFGAARDLTCNDASQALRLEGEALDDARTLYHPEAMTWEQRESHVDGSEATVVVEQHYRGLPDTNGPFSLRMDYELERSLGTWTICDTTQYFIDERGDFLVNDCAEQQGLQVFREVCSETKAYPVVDEVKDAEDCAVSDPVLIEQKSDGRIFCVDMSKPAEG